jgi:predicted GNAT family N-acyltransferase
MQNGGFEIKTGSWAVLGPDATAVRVEVFVKGQGIPAEMEWDALDAEVTHSVVYDATQQPIATGRLIPLKTSVDAAKIGRMAVLKSHRRLGVGDLVMRALMTEAAQRGYQHLELSAQAYVADFYTKHGFVAEGPLYDDVGIAHVTMRYSFTKAQSIK